MTVVEKNTEVREVSISCCGSWVPKYDIRRVLNLKYSFQYIAEVNLLKKEIDGFEIRYQEGATRNNLQVDLAIFMIEHIISKTGCEVKVNVQYQ